MKDDVAVRLKKKDYDEVFPLYYQGCDAVLNQYEKKLDWADFASHVYTYAEVIRSQETSSKQQCEV